MKSEKDVLVRLEGIEKEIGKIRDKIILDTNNRVPGEVIDKSAFRVLDEFLLARKYLKWVLD